MGKLCRVCIKATAPNRFNWYAINLFLFALFYLNTFIYILFAALSSVFIFYGTTI